MIKIYDMMIYKCVAMHRRALTTSSSIGAGTCILMYAYVICMYVFPRDTFRLSITMQSQLLRIQNVLTYILY